MQRDYDRIRVFAAAVFLLLSATSYAAEPQSAAFDTVPLVSAFHSAKEFDPQFRGALAERTVNEAAVTTARYAYAPQGQYSIQQSELETAARRTFQVTQPLINADRYLSWREAGPRAQFAESTLAQREQDLAQRLLKAVTELVRAREGLRVNEYQISLLEEQAKRAKRMYQLEEGTVTDMADTAVRLEQARAARLGLLARIEVAENQYEAIVGTLPSKGAFRIAETPRRFALDPMERYLDAARSTNPQLVSARQSELLMESGARRAKAALVPQVSAVYISTQSAGRSLNYIGTSLIIPFQGQTIAQISSATAQAERAREQTRQTEQQLKVEIQRLRALVDSGQQEWAIRREAILAAELAVRANLKSQQGGIRTSVDVLNAIQTLAQIRNDYASTAATLAENYLNLLLQSAYDSSAALEKVQTGLFER